MIAAAGLVREDRFALVSAATGLLIWSVAAQGRMATALSSAPLQFLGAISYSLYLTHNFVLGAGNRGAGGTVAWETGGWLASTAVAVLVAAVVWRAVEMPSMRLARRIAMRG